ALATDAFKILADHWIQRALVVFKSKNSSNYRFSYLTISLDMNDKNKIVRKYSNARRYSFYIGPNAKIRTPEQQLMKKGRIKDVEDLLNRFSLEVVNKEFYLQIAAAFDSLVERGTSPNLLLPSVSPENVNVYKNFAVRLIGRIMFCWFLKQKKSESGQLISDELLSSQTVANTEGYYHGVLEPLFFEVLNTPREERGVRDALYDQVPYLNGGLFNPQRDDYYALDHGTYASRHINTLTIQDGWFKEFFTLLETYNFTIDENTVFDQELSVDPEMLGRIFENLLAEINPETGSSERNRTGSFYTPRQIVEYMVDQSLLVHLKNKTNVAEEKLVALISYDQGDDINNPLSQTEKKQVIDAIADLRVLDPACGSGAFPVGILQKIVYILQTVDADCSLWIDKKLQMVPSLWKQRVQDYYSAHPANYIRKLDVIKGSIFGVDIQPIAVEVSRLRCFLTLVVESKIDDSAPNRGIEPLPNLEFKFVCANTLIGLPEAQNKGMFDDHVGIETLSQIMSDYFNASSAKKEEVKLKFTRTQNEILTKAITTLGQSTGELTQKLTFWNPFGNESSSWFNPKWMFGTEESFDIVIGNPPYGLLNKKQNQKLGFLVTEEQIKYFKDNQLYLPARGGMINAFRLFVCKSVELLNVNGNLNLIIPLAFLCDLSSSNLRRYLIENYRFNYLEAFPERDDENKRVFGAVKMSVCILGLTKTSKPGHEIHLRIHRDKYVDLTNENVTISRDFIRKNDPEGLAIPLVDFRSLNLISKIREKSLRLEDVAKCFTGEVDLTADKKYLSSNPADAKLIKGAQVQQYQLLDKMSQGEIMYLKESEYQASRNSARSSHNELKRIVMQGITGVNESVRLKMTIADPYTYCANSVNYIVPKRTDYPISFLLGFLNSKLANWCFVSMSTNSNVNGYEVDNLPIVAVSKSDQDIIAVKVEIILRNPKSDLAVRSSGEIDSIIYRLYEFSPDEIQIIEASHV
ncbi:MAG TPA: TaqI-like C-terminal specificity domain-containing protein, partial [Candidatus Paceibacterota bacterium]